MRVSDKRKYGGLMRDLSIQYEIKNHLYPKKLQEVVDVMRKVRFKQKNNNDKSNTQKQNKMEVLSKINQMKQVLHKHIDMKTVILLWFGNVYVKYF